jgi:hypothetical protein
MPGSALRAQNQKVRFVERNDVFCEFRKMHVAKGYLEIFGTGDLVPQSLSDYFPQLRVTGGVGFLEFQVHQEAVQFTFSRIKEHYDRQQ